MSSRKNARPKHKNHAQDCGTLCKGLSVRRSCHGFVVWMACILSVVTGTLPVTPSGRIAAGRLRLSAIIYKEALSAPSDAGQASPDRALAHGLFRKTAYAGLRTTMLERAQQARVYLPTSSTTNVVLFDQRLVSRFVRLLQIVQKRTARRHELQQAAARMIVLHVRLEVPGQVVDAFRQDRDLNLRRAGVAGLDGISLDDFRFAFGGNRHRQTLSLRPALAVSPVRLNTRLGMSSPLPISASAKRRPATVT